MERFKEAEKMHLKAIQIKENLLGPDDYEVTDYTHSVPELDLRKKNCSKI